MSLRQEAVLCNSSLNWPMGTDPAGRGMWLEGTVWDHVAGDQDQKGGAGMPGKGCLTSASCCAVLWQSSSQGQPGDFPHSTCSRAHSDARKEQMMAGHAQRSHILVVMLRLSITTSSSDPARMVSDKGEMAKS